MAQFVTTNLSLASEQIKIIKEVLGGGSNISK